MKTNVEFPPANLTTDWRLSMLIISSSLNHEKSPTATMGRHVKTSVQELQHLGPFNSLLGSE